MIALDAAGADRGPAEVAEGGRRAGVPVTLYGPASELSGCGLPVDPQANRDYQRTRQMGIGDLLLGESSYLAFHVDDPDPVGHLSDVHCQICSGHSLSSLSPLPCPDRCS